MRYQNGTWLLLTGFVVALFAPRAHAQLAAHFYWITPCVDDLSCGAMHCWCEGDWDADDVWGISWIEPCEGPECQEFTDTYPQRSNQDALIEKSNAPICNGGGDKDGQPCDPHVQCPGGGYCVLGLCAGGDDDGEPCNPNWDCRNIPEWGTCEYDYYLLLNLTTETMGEFTIKTEATAVDDHLDLRIASKGTGGKTLTAERVEIDATNGPVEVRISDSARLKTDTTD